MYYIMDHKIMKFWESHLLNHVTICVNNVESEMHETNDGEPIKMNHTEIMFASFLYTKIWIILRHQKKDSS